MVYLALIVPVALLGLMLAMERIEQPLRDAAVSERIGDWLDEARPDELEEFVRETLSRPLNRYWRRQRISRRRTRAAAAPAGEADST